MLIIEKIEGSIIEIEDGDSHFSADIADFDDKIHEGDVVVRTVEGRYKKDINATTERRNAVIKLQNSLWK